jgi:hypothetical protein
MENKSAIECWHAGNQNVSGISAMTIDSLFAVQLHHVRFKNALEYIILVYTLPSHLLKNGLHSTYYLVFLYLHSTNS